MENDTIREHIFKSGSEKLKIIQKYLEVCERLGSDNGEGSVQKSFDELNILMENSRDVERQATAKIELIEPDK